MKIVVLGLAVTSLAMGCKTAGGDQGSATQSAWPDESAAEAAHEQEEEQGQQKPADDIHGDGEYQHELEEQEAGIQAPGLGSNVGASQPQTAAIKDALKQLVEIFGTNIGPAAIYGDSNPPHCKVYLNFLDDGKSPTPGVRFSVEQLNFFVPVARRDFTGFISGITKLQSAQVATNGAITLVGPGGTKLRVSGTDNGRPLVDIDGLSCAAQQRLVF